MADKKGRFDVYKLAKLFYKYHFFNDDLCILDETAYYILCDVYASLDTDTKTRLHVDYDIVKSREERRASRRI